MRSWRHVVGHDDLQRVALAAADHREADAGVAGRRLEDRLAGLDEALLLGALDERARDAVLDGARRVVGLHLRPDAHARLGAQTLELDERRVADRLHDVAVTTPARPVLERQRRHQVTECSPARLPRSHLARATLSCCPVASWPFGPAYESSGHGRDHGHRGAMASGSARRSSRASPSRRRDRGAARRRRTSRRGRR